MSNPLKQIYNACDPYEPASSEHYCSCAEARGESVLAQEFLRRLKLTDQHISFLFSGHIGCGKSSELEQLRRVLTNNLPYHPRYFPILIDVSDYLDDYDVTPTDILLAIITDLADTLKEELGIELKDNYFVKRINEVKEFFLSDVEVNEGELPLWGAKLKIQRLKKDPDARKKVREKLEPKMSTMLEEINLVFDEARLAIKKYDDGSGKQPYEDIVVILDNLEKIRRIAGLDEGLPSQRELFLERYTQLTGMNAHFIYTVPLRLVRSADGPQLEQRYGQLFVLPMIKVIKRGSREPFEKGMDGLRELLQKRLGGLAIDRVFGHDALEFLLKYSGGHVRNLMTFVQNACAYSDDLPISLKAAQRAVQQSVRTYSTAIPEHHWSKLVELDRSPNQEIANGDLDFLVMLENLSVLEYIDEGDEDTFAVAEPWYAVNPIVRELKKFKAAQQERTEEGPQ